MENEKSYKGKDPQPQHGNDGKGHNGNGKNVDPQPGHGNDHKGEHKPPTPSVPPTRPTKPATSHAVGSYGQLFV